LLFKVVGVAKTPSKGAECKQTRSTWTECFLNRTRAAPGEGGPIWAGRECALISFAVVRDRSLLLSLVY